MQHVALTLSTAIVTILMVFSCKESSPPSAKPETVAPVSADKSVQRKPAINGAGATFPYPIYSKWAHDYNRISGTELNYQSIGSGGGIAQIKAKTVDFGATDAPLSKSALDLEGLVQFPMVIGGVVPVVNVEGVAPGALKLTAELLANLFLGKVTKWNDPAIAKLNPDLELPDRDVVVVHRADGSGTTWIFTSYLGKISPEWRESVGTGKAVRWPTGMGGKGNEGVASYVQRVSGSIGYVEFAYALQNDMSHVRLQNRDGQFVSPTMDAFKAAAANADWKNAPGFYRVLTDQPGETTWPITGASFILLHKEQPDMEKAREMLKFFDFCYRKGREDAKTLHYVSMPEAVIELVRNEWKRDVKVGGEPVWK